MEYSTQKTAEVHDKAFKAAAEACIRIIWDLTDIYESPENRLARNCGYKMLVEARDIALEYSKWSSHNGFIKAVNDITVYWNREEKHWTHPISVIRNCATLIRAFAL